MSISDKRFPYINTTANSGTNDSNHLSDRAFIIIYSILDQITYVILKRKYGMGREKLFQSLLNGIKAAHHNSASIYPDFEAILYMRSFKRFRWNSVETSL